VPITKAATFAARREEGGVLAIAPAIANAVARFAGKGPRPPAVATERLKQSR
jgi:hypothetical protein